MRPGGVSEAVSPSCNQRSPLQPSRVHRARHSGRLPLVSLPDNTTRLCALKPLAILRFPLPFDLLRPLLVVSPLLPSPESSHLRWRMGACVLFAALCSNMQLLFCCFVYYLEWIYLLASLTVRWRGVVAALHLCISRGRCATAAPSVPGWPSAVVPLPHSRAFFHAPATPLLPPSP
jgi:hypothetical protein